MRTQLPIFFKGGLSYGTKGSFLWVVWNRKVLENKRGYRAAFWEHKGLRGLRPLDPILDSSSAVKSC